MEIRSVEPTPPHGISGAPPVDAQVDAVRPAAPVAPVRLDEISAQPERENEQKNSSREHVKRIAESVNNVLAQSGNHIRFVVHEESKRMMVQVRDDQTDTVIRTIPDKELLDLSAKIGDLIGMLLDERT